MISNEHVSKIQSALEQDSYAVLRKFLPDAYLPTWGETINAINEASHIKPDGVLNRPFAEYQINKAVRRGVGYFYAFIGYDANYVLHMLQPVADFLTEKGLPFEVAIVFANLFTGDEYAEVHRDGHANSIYIQTNGSTHWKLYETMDTTSSYTEFDLEKGDAVFFTSNVYHSVLASTPRTGAVLQWIKDRH